MSGDASKEFLAQLLTAAARNNCACEPCQALRRAWTMIGLAEPPPSVPMCASCAEHPEGRRILQGAVGVGTIDGETDRCVLCGMKLAA